ncbi:MAG: hypothetical protein WAL30_03060 [Candidatus Aquirickettsiella sp.]
MPSFRDGDFQEENRDSPLEWLGPSLARAHASAKKKKLDPLA